LFNSVVVDRERPEGHLVIDSVIGFTEPFEPVELGSVSILVRNQDVIRIAEIAGGNHER
jgi:hypothetical protein